MGKTHDTQKYHAALATENNTEILNPESRLRYYEITSNLSEEFEKKKEIPIVDLIEQIQMNKNKQDKSLIKENKRELETMVYDRNNVKRKGSVGGYIPINHL